MFSNFDVRRISQSSGIGTASTSSTASPEPQPQFWPHPEFSPFYATSASSSSQLLYQPQQQQQQDEPIDLSLASCCAIPMQMQLKLDSEPDQMQDEPLALVVRPLPPDQSKEEHKEAGGSCRKRKLSSIELGQREMPQVARRKALSGNDMPLNRENQPSTPVKPYICTVCLKVYARKSHLTVHYRVHTGERPFVCDKCGKDFTEKRFLNDHTQTAHVEGSDKCQPLTCPNCGREFAYKTSLKQHLKKQMCIKNICRSTPNAKTATTGALVIVSDNPTENQAEAGNRYNSPYLTGTTVGPTSSLSLSSDKQYACPMCTKSYSWKQTLKQHMLMYHQRTELIDLAMPVGSRAGLEVCSARGQSQPEQRLVDAQIETEWRHQLGRHAQPALQQQKLVSDISSLALRTAVHTPVLMALLTQQDTYSGRDANNNVITSCRTADRTYNMSEDPSEGRHDAGGMMIEPGPSSLAAESAAAVSNRRLCT